MSAIWGVVALDDEILIPTSAKEIFETTYKETCRIERYENRIVSNAYMGCGIQYITEESKREELPIYDKERGIVFAADCILDNREEVSELLATYGYDRQSLEQTPDGKLMYFAYLCMGKNCTKAFRGLFTMAIWDEKKRRLTLLSDQVAARCLYFIRRGNLVAFSTLMEPLVRLFPDVEQNINYYKDFLLVNPSIIYVVPGETPYQEISLMLPATDVEFDSKGEKMHTYWTVEDCEDEKERKKKRTSAKDYGKRFLELYRSCVKDALRSAGEIGIAMSSGLDSSSIGALAAKELGKSRKTLYSYTFVPYNHFKNVIVGSSVYDESELVKEIVKMYPNIKPTFLNNGGRNIFEDMDSLTQILEMPYKTGTFSNHYEMCREGASAGCKVFLNGGFGNNTVSYGEIMHILYDLYGKKRIGKLLRYANRFGKHEKVSRRSILTLICRNFGSYKKYYEERLEHFVPDNFLLCPSILDNYDLKQRFSKDKRTIISEGYIDREKYKEHLKATSLLMYLGVFETKFGLNTGMILRDPTKDIRMMSFCYQLPYHMFAYGGMTRWLVRKQFEPLLPKGILNPWRQHGLLNADWMKHIERDWEMVKPELQKNLSLSWFDGWIDKKRMTDMIEHFGEDEGADRRVMNYLCAIDGLRRYIQLQEDKKS